MENRKKIKQIRAKLMLKEITYEKALELCDPIIKEMNKKASLIAKKYNKKPPVFNARYLLR